MPWNDNSGNNNPWGSPPDKGNDNKKGGSPWGGGGGSGSSGGGGRGGPDLEEVFRRGQQNMPNLFQGKSFVVFLILLVLAWGATGFYRVQPDQQGLVLTFGKWDGERRQPGLGYHLPWPIQTILTPQTTRIRQTEIGGTGRQKNKNESLMLTSDENIVDIQFVVQWNIANTDKSNAGDYLFKIADPEDTVKIAAESVMREIIGQTRIDPILTEQRAQIAQDVKRDLQKLLNDYSAGINVESVEFQQADPPEQVIEAFNDVQAARQDQQSKINEATAYANKVKPRAEGDAFKLVQDAEAYKQQVMNRSTGEAARFISVLDSYKAAPEVTRERLYLETLEEVMTGSDKVILQGGANGNVLPFLPIGRGAAANPLQQAPARSSTAPRPSTGTGSSSITMPKPATQPSPAGFSRSTR